MKQKCTTQQFVEKARKVHGDFYDYSRVDYQGNKVKVTVICPVHGEFQQTPSDHLSGRGCRKCSYEQRGINSRISQEEFERRAHIRWGSRFKYGKYTGMHSYIEVTCPEHGVFLVTPHNHLMGCGCPRCQETSGEFLIRKYLEDNRYSYKSQVRIVLPKTINGINIMIPDFIVFANNKKYIIEYNGIQHYQYIPFFHSGGVSDFNKQQTRDNLLRTLCKRSNIKLIEIDYRLSDEQVINLLNKELNEV